MFRIEAATGLFHPPANGSERPQTMTTLKIHDETTAPEAARTALAGVRKAYGLLPNVLGALAENPVVLDAYLALGTAASKAGFTPLEAQVAQITVSVENECHFCVAAHSAVAKGQKLDDSVIAAVRARRPIADPKLEALRDFTRKVVVNRGFVSDADVASFKAAGWTDSAILGVILITAMKSITNYVNHIAETPLNPEFAAFAWSPARSPEVVA
jgi:uncharacterized peroxidase-related enzyme